MDIPGKLEHWVRKTQNEGNNNLKKNPHTTEITKQRSNDRLLDKMIQKVVDEMFEFCILHYSIINVFY